MHRLLARQLKQLNLGDAAPPDLEGWKSFLDRVQHTYAEEERRRYLLDRSLSLASEEMQTLNARLRDASEMRRAILRALPDPLFLVNEDGHFLEMLSGDIGEEYSHKIAWLGRALIDVLPNDLAISLREAIQQSLDSQAMQSIEYELRMPHGEMCYEGRMMATDVVVEGRRTVVFLVRDITELRRSRELLARAAYHDELTDLANRRLFMDRTDQAVSQSLRTGQLGAVFFIDLDHFKQINDTLGHAVGDRLLVAVAQRLKQVCRMEDTVARLGGDEFAILATMFTDAEQAEAMARKLNDALAEPFDLGVRQYDAHGSIGACVFPSHARSRHEALLHADAAMYAAKQAGRGCYRLYASAT